MVKSVSPYNEIEKKWQKYWKDNKVFCAEEKNNQKKYYILDMFPYPSGAGLHVGHPLGYIASDVIARYKRLQGYNVLHPMGYDSFGLPAEQYAIQTGQHPALTTHVNAKRYREQLDAIGLSLDWSREIFTSDPEYYKHTQWTFIQLFQSYYDKKNDKAKPVAELISSFEKDGNILNFLEIHHSCLDHFNGNDWKNFSEEKKSDILQHYRMAYLADSLVNWCPGLGTVLANDEVKEGLSVRGGFPVEQKKMKQWQLRITAYADRLLDHLEKLDWPVAVKEMQRNWIGKSAGAEVTFDIENSKEKITVFTTRPDTIFGVSFIVVAPESDQIEKYITESQKKAVKDYQLEIQKKSERERNTEVKSLSGVPLGTYAIHPFTNEKIPLWTSEYVLANYGTGVVMAVPAHDSRDYVFAKKFQLKIREVVTGGNVEEKAYEEKNGTLINSTFLNGLDVTSAINLAIKKLEEIKVGKGRIQFRLRDAIFSRQRYWGEPIPIYYKNGIPFPLDKSDLPLVLPEVDKYLPTESGEPPLARAKNWQTKDGYPLELSTMPGFAGSCAYFLRYMDTKNANQLVSKEKNAYWKDVDFYVGGSEHATGHLLYSRFWNHFLFDLGEVESKEPFKKLFNQGMILGRSSFVYRIKGTKKFVTLSKINQYETQMIHTPVSFVRNDFLDINQWKAWREEFADSEFILNEDGKYECGVVVEKMSKSFHNVINPDDIILEYGADAFRLYEMFLGPLDQAKPWNTNGIEGVSRFLQKFLRLYFDDQKKWLVLENESATIGDLRILHQTIKKVKNDFESFSLNTSISALMICVNELTKSNCHSSEILGPLCVLLSPFAPHICEEVWEQFKTGKSICYTQFPICDEKYLEVDEFEYAISFNGKTRFTMTFKNNLLSKEIENLVLENEQTKKWVEGQTIKKVIVVPKKIVNIVF